MTAPPTHRPPRAGVRASASSPTQLWVLDEIGEFGVSAAAFVENLRAAGGGPVDLYVSSPGGSLFDGLAMAAALQRHPGRIVAYVDGLAASAASVLIMSADEIVMSPNSLLMVHCAASMTAGDARDHRAAADVLDRADGLIAATYAARSGTDAATWQAAMEKESWFTGPEAVAAGLADRVGEAPRVADPVFAVHRAMDRTEHRQMAGGQISATIRGGIRAAFGGDRHVRNPGRVRRPVPSPMAVLRELRSVFR